MIHLDSEDEVLSTLVEIFALQMDEVDLHVMSPTHHGTLGVTNSIESFDPPSTLTSVDVDKTGKNTLPEKVIE